MENKLKRAQEKKREQESMLGKYFSREKHIKEQIKLNRQEKESVWMKEQDHGEDVRKRRKQRD